MTIEKTLNHVLNLIAEQETVEPKIVGKKLKPNELRLRFDFSLKKSGTELQDIFSIYQKYLELTPNTRIPEFQNQLFSGHHPVSLGAEILSAYTNTTMATYEVSPVSTLIERELVQHFLKKIGWFSGDGIMVTGGSNANFVAMLVARNLKFPETKLFGSSGLRLTAFVSEESHYSFDKAMNMLGLGLHSLKKIPSDESGKMIPEKLRDAILESLEKKETPFFIGATAGTTVLGAYDPIAEISKIAQEFNLWLHVDGAWGGSALFSQRYRSLMEGLEKADSFCVDTHKMLGTGLISSFFLTKHSHALRKSNDSGGSDYIFHQPSEDSLDLGPSSLQCGRRADAFKVWCLWKFLGDEGIEKYIDELFKNAKIAVEIIKDRSDFQLLHEPQMLNICFTFKDSKFSVKKTREKLLESGSHYLNISTRKEITFFRLILTNIQQDHKEVLRTLEAINFNKELE